MGRAVVKGSSTAADAQTPAQQFVAYLLPKEEGADEADYMENGGELEWVREYAYEVKREAEGDSYFLVMGSNEVAYNEFSSKIAATRKAFQRRVDTAPHPGLRLHV